jgi:hypothetical protein
MNYFWKPSRKSPETLKRSNSPSTVHSGEEDFSLLSSTDTFVPNFEDYDSSISGFLRRTTKVITEPISKLVTNTDAIIDTHRRRSTVPSTLFSPKQESSEVLYLKKFLKDCLTLVEDENFISLNGANFEYQMQLNDLRHELFKWKELYAESTEQNRMNKRLIADLKTKFVEAEERENELRLELETQKSLFSSMKPVQKSSAKNQQFIQSKNYFVQSNNVFGTALMHRESINFWEITKKNETNVEKNCLVSPIEDGGLSLDYEENRAYNQEFSTSSYFSKEDGIGKQTISLQNSQHYLERVWLQGTIGIMNSNRSDPANNNNSVSENQPQELFKNADSQVYLEKAWLEGSIGILKYETSLNAMDPSTELNGPFSLMITESPQNMKNHRHEATSDDAYSNHIIDITNQNKQFKDSQSSIDLERTLNVVNAGIQCINENGSSDANSGIPTHCNYQEHQHYIENAWQLGTIGIQAAVIDLLSETKNKDEGLVKENQRQELVNIADSQVYLEKAWLEGSIGIIKYETSLNAMDPSTELNGPFALMTTQNMKNHRHEATSDDAYSNHIIDITNQNKQFKDSQSSIDLERTLNVVNAGIQCINENGSSEANSGIPTHCNYQEHQHYIENAWQLGTIGIQAAVIDLLNETKTKVDVVVEKRSSGTKRKTFSVQSLSHKEKNPNILSDQEHLEMAWICGTLNIFAESSDIEVSTEEMKYLEAAWSRRELSGIINVLRLIEFSFTALI